MFKTHLGNIKFLLTNLWSLCVFTPFNAASDMIWSKFLRSCLSHQGLYPLHLQSQCLLHHSARTPHCGDGHGAMGTSWHHLFVWGVTGEEFLWRFWNLKFTMKSCLDCFSIAVLNTWNNWHNTFEKGQLTLFLLQVHDSNVGRNPKCYGWSTFPHWEIRV